jgi:hypothetical protein
MERGKCGQIAELLCHPKEGRMEEPRPPDWGLPPTLGLVKGQSSVSHPRLHALEKSLSAQHHIRVIPPGLKLLSVPGVLAHPQYPGFSHGRIPPHLLAIREPQQGRRKPEIPFPERLRKAAGKRDLMVTHNIRYMEQPHKCTPSITMI